MDLLDASLEMESLDMTLCLARRKTEDGRRSREVEIPSGRRFRCSVSRLPSPVSRRAGGKP